MKPQACNKNETAPAPRVSRQRVRALRPPALRVQGPRRRLLWIPRGRVRLGAAPARLGRPAVAALVASASAFNQVSLEHGAAFGNSGPPLTGRETEAGTRRGCGRGGGPAPSEFAMPPAAATSSNTVRRTPPCKHKCLRVAVCLQPGFAQGVAACTKLVFFFLTLGGIVLLNQRC
nr:uncharacterized protein LOC123480504 isoform X2 [Desmodus rotundus]